MATKKSDYDHIYEEVPKYYVQQVLLTKELYEYQFNEWEKIAGKQVKQADIIILCAWNIHRFAT